MDSGIVDYDINISALCRYRGNFGVIGYVELHGDCPLTQFSAQGLRRIERACSNIDSFDIALNEFADECLANPAIATRYNCNAVFDLHGY
jgi:hypothetical protein